MNYAGGDGIYRRLKHSDSEEFLDYQLGLNGDGIGTDGCMQCDSDFYSFSGLSYLLDPSGTAVLEGAILIMSTSTVLDGLYSDSVNIYLEW